MAEVYVLDNYYLAITLLITVGYQLAFFSIAYTCQFDKLTDFAGGTNFVILAIITLAFSGHTSARQIVASLFIMVWAVRLAGFLLFRIIKTGSDTRFDDKRNKFFPFLGFWVFQMVWVWSVSLPVTLINSPNITQWPQPAFGTGCDIAGVILFALGLVTEAWADLAKYRFKAVGAGAHDKAAVCRDGPWRWSRHPNYFGEIVVQFAIFTICVAPAAYGYIPRGSGNYSALFATILGPFFLTILLLFVSGLPLNERPTAKKRYEAANNWPAYKAYLDSTSILLPMPPALWRPLPRFIKRSIGFEWPIYVFDPAKHADPKAHSDNAAESGSAQGEDYRDGDAHGDTSAERDRRD